MPKLFKSYRKLTKCRSEEAVVTIMVALPLAVLPHAACDYVGLCCDGGCPDLLLHLPARQPTFLRDMLPPTSGGGCSTRQHENSEEFAFWKEMFHFSCFVRPVNGHLTDTLHVGGRQKKLELCHTL